jgi:small-conductance mechanosensitive channel
MEIFDLVGPNKALSIFGVKLVGFTAENGRKALLTISLFILLFISNYVIKRFLRLFVRGKKDARTLFWSNQAINIIFTLLFSIGFISIWFDDPVRLATAFGLISAGLAFALQKVVTAISGYFIILRGRLFNVGDRISMGGVRGDVISLRFTTTSVMEMGQPPAVQNADPAMWVEARQYTGRIVTITNDKIFENSVYNYTRYFPYLWEEMHVMIKYGADRKRAEEVMLEIARRHTIGISEISKYDLMELERRFLVKETQVEPRVYYRITDNWLELTLRFIALDHNVRELKDLLSREIIAAFERETIEIASTTVDIVGLPASPVQVKISPASGNGNYE